MYKPIVVTEKLLIGTGYPVIVAGWSNLTRTSEVQPPPLSELIPASLYSVMGNLRNVQRGFKYLIINLLANPAYRDVVLYCNTLYDRNANIIRDYEEFEAGRIVIKGLDTYHQDLVRERVRFHACTEGVTALERLLVTLKPTPQYPPFERIELRVKESEESAFKGRYQGNVITEDTIAEVWLKLIKGIRANGVLRNTKHGVKWQECLNVLSVIRNEPADYYLPTFTGITREMIDTYRPLIVEESKPDGIKYTYGSRLRSHFGVDQVRQVIEKLKEEPSAASAVMSLWDVRDHELGGSPCLNHLWLRLTEEGLVLTALFRSHDIFGAWLLNAYGLRELQTHIAEQVGVEMGALMILSQSAHIYEDCWDFVDSIKPNRKRKFDDSCGYFTVEFDGQIKVTQICGDSERVYTGKTPVELFLNIERDNPHMDTSHALYLGAEINDCFRDRELYLQR